MSRSVFLVLAIWLAFIARSGFGQTDSVQEIIRKRVEQIRFSDVLTIGDARITSVAVLPELYERRNFEPAWTRRNTIENLITAIREVDEDGLDPSHYHLEPLQQLHAKVAGSESPDALLLADLDLLLTDSLVRLSYHIAFGKVDPEAVNAHWNLAREIRDRDPVKVIQDAIGSGSPGELIQNLRPQHAFYKRMRSALAEYRAIEAAGGWEPVPAGPLLRKGSRDGRVELLRRRLEATGDISVQGSDASYFDEELRKSVIAFQNRHSLAADGVVGRRTLRALNVTVGERIDQVRVNLERARWVFHELTDKDEFVMVDIAGFEVFFIRDGKMSWTSRAQVGRPYRQTPVFKSVIRYIVLNPTWTIPFRIFRDDILPEIKRDPDYLEQQDIKVIDDDGNIIAAESLDWSKYSARNFPYQLRQEPGLRNALGRIKIIFPNPHFVYLHETPSKSLFQHPDRAFTSGCIRVEKPFELAVLLLNSRWKWSLGKVMQAVDSGRTRTIFLRKPIPVLLLYSTVRLAEDGRLIFKKDVYDRDREVLAGLDGEMRVEKRRAEKSPRL